METRRIPRIKQRDARRITVVIASIGALGFGVGLALPRSATAPLLLLAVGVASLAAAGVRVAAGASGRELTRQIQTSSLSAASAVVDWLRSKMVPVGLVQEEMLPNAHVDIIDIVFHDGFVGPLLPARYEAIESAALRPEYSSERTSQHRVRSERQHRGEHGLTRTVDRACEKLNNTRHLWALIAVIYAFMALFALVVTLTVLGH